jgi:uncharacterized protein DUF6909
VDRQPPRAISDEIALYVRTYYSLLRSSGDVRVRAFEEAHLYSSSSLHSGAAEMVPDLAAFAYSAARLPEPMPEVERVVLGQSFPQFAKAGWDVGSWQVVRTRGRRRPLRYDGRGTLAVFVASGSDIDDLVPIVTAYQIEWNKIRAALSSLPAVRDPDAPLADSALAVALGTGPTGPQILRAALGPAWRRALAVIANRECDLSMRLLDGSFREYHRSALRWWQAIEPVYRAGAVAAEQASPSASGLLRGPAGSEDGPPIYFVSSNNHALANLLGGFARCHVGEITAYTRERNPEGLADDLEAAVRAGDETTQSAILYYALRAYLHDPTHGADRVMEVQRFDAESGIHSIFSPGRIDVDAQIIELARLSEERLDPRIRVPGFELLRDSRAVIVNIDYPLGLAAYHHLCAVGFGVGEVRGVYVMGKAATLNGRVGDVMIPKAVHDEHSSNTYLFRNGFVADDVQPYMRHGTVLDNQKALTVRSAFLQNRDYMDVYYREGYTIMEMEAGPYLSALYEIVSPTRHPRDEIISLADVVDFDVGLLHYASDTPYSRRQSLLSKSLSYFGVESTYACAIAIARRILAAEVARIEDGPTGRRGRRGARA